MRKISKAVLSAGLAAATVVSGLSFGAAAATAATNSPLSTTGPSPLVFETSPSTFWSIQKGSNGASFTQFGTLAAAESASRPFNYDDETQRIQYADGPTYCLGVADRANHTRYLTATLCKDEPRQRFTFASGGLKSVFTGSFVTKFDPLALLDDGAPAKVHSEFSSFNGQVSEFSVVNRSATITVSASPNASIIYTVNGGPEQDPKADADGKWSVDLTGLKLGVNTVHFEQWEKDTENGGNKKTGEFDLDVDLKVAPVTAKYAFDAQRNMPVAVTGSAEPSAVIEIKDASDKVVTTTRANDVTGNWQTTIPAPNAGGTYTVRVDQKVDGETVTGPSLNIDYGSGVVVTTPGNDWVHDGGKLAMAGTGEPEAQIQVREQGKQGVIGETEVLANGKWNLTTSDLDAKKHDLVITQSAKGNNTTTASITLNPDADKQDVTVTSPKNGDQYDANSVLRFTGQGTPGAQIELDPNNGLAKYYATVTPGGTWTIDRPMGTGPYTFSVIQNVNGVEQSRVDGIAVTAKSTAPIIKDFKLTSPEANSFHQGQTVTFTGEGAAGDTVRLHVTNFTSTDVTATVKNDGTWSVSKYLGSGAYTFDITQEHAGTVTGAVRGFELNQTADKNLPFAITSPESGSNREGQTTFTGTGSAGSKVEMTVTNFASAPVSTTVNSDGTWSIARYIGVGAYTFDVTQTNAAGTVTDTIKDYRINQPKDGVDKPFAVSGPSTGSTFTANTNVAFTGTGPIGAAIEVKPTNGLASVSTEVKVDGTWSVSKFLGNGPYTFEVIMTPKSGAAETSAPISLTPATK